MMSIYADIKNKAYDMGAFKYEPIIRRQAVILGFVPPTRTCSLNLAGSTTVIEGVRYLSSYFPQIGDTVWVDIKGGDLLVIGAMEGVWVSYTSPSILGMSPGTQQARYHRDGQTCIFNFNFHWTGTNGTGTPFAVQLPFYHTPLIDETVGSMKYTHSSGAHQPGSCYMEDSQPYIFFIGTAGIVSGGFGLGVTPNSGSRLTATITYEVSLGA